MMRVGGFRDWYTLYWRLTAGKVRDGYRGSCHVSASDIEDIVSAQSLSVGP